MDVADQGASTFEFLEHEFHGGRRFVVRNGRIRKVYAGHEPIGPQRYVKDYVEALSIWRHGKPRGDWTIHDFFFALARLGGHQNRKGDHRPGWLILWRGWMKLQCNLDGYLAAERKQCGQT